MNAYGMDYEDALEALVTRDEARHEIDKHVIPDDDSPQATWERFLREVGDKQEYRGSEVLDWLGY